ncbi:N-formylglutamate deformylase [Roseovarius aestuarii]|nr:N-formylglutamate deformylase [Roseovarius aestuarii]
MPPIYALSTGSSPLVVNVPHAGLALSAGLEDRLRPEARDLKDTDWHMIQIAQACRPLGASLMSANFSRYVIDLNRSADDEALYAGATTGLVSDIDFDGNPLYLEGQEPTRPEIAARISDYWAPYHLALKNEISRVKAQHGVCVLLDLHSIRSEVPRLFDGRLPDLNLGTNSGRSAGTAFIECAEQVLASTSLTKVTDGRFKGGFITRHYAQPSSGVHALQLEISQRIYMQESPPWTLDPAGTEALQSVVRALACDLIKVAQASIAPHANMTTTQ